MCGVWIDGVISDKRETYEAAKELACDQRFADSIVLIKQDDCILFRSK